MVSTNSTFEAKVVDVEVSRTDFEAVSMEVDRGLTVDFSRVAREMDLSLVGVDWTSHGVEGAPGCVLTQAVSLDDDDFRSETAVDERTVCAVVSYVVTKLTVAWNLAPEESDHRVAGVEGTTATCLEVN